MWTDPVRQLLAAYAAADAHAAGALAEARRRQWPARKCRCFARYQFEYELFHHLGH